MSLWGLDVAPLRASKEFRRLYIASAVTALGTQATYVTMPYQLKELTHSPLQVGALGLAELVPLVFCGLYGGILADRMNRRRLIITMEALLMLTTALIFANALLGHPSIVILYVTAFFNAAVSSLQRPSIAALNQSFVPHDLQRSASTLQMISGTTASIIGPVTGGLAAVALGAQFVYGANLLTFCASLILLSRLSRQDTPVVSDQSDRAAFRAGLDFLRSRPDIIGTYVIDLVAMVVAFPVAMLPFVASRFHETYALSLLYGAMPVGALVASVTSGWSTRVHHYGRAVVAAAITWGLGIAVFGFSSSLTLALIGLVVAGGADALSAVFRATMWNESIRPDIRGRMAGMEMISYSIGPTAGQFRAGLMAAWTSLRFSLTAGGLGCSAAVAGVACALPSLWRFDVRTDVHVAEVRELRSAEASNETREN